MSNLLRVWLDEINHTPNAIAPGKVGSARGSLPDYQGFRRIVDLLQSLVDQKAASFAVERRDKPQGCPLPLAQVTADAQVKAVADGLRYAEGRPAGTCVLTRREDVLV